jgi:hypothetical protein
LADREGGHPGELFSRQREALVEVMDILRDIAWARGTGKPPAPAMTWQPER